ncbi:MAG: cupin domain-containing protein [Alphaproteobacteria bacterium]|nr:cupin domain-containing protein [Alphaproteobacteria bacterium]
MTRAAPVRRVVTGHDAGGRAVVKIDGEAPNARFREAAKLTSTLLWVEDETPADNAGDADKSLRESGVAPPDGGSVFRLVEFPPEGEAGEFSNAAMKAEMGLDAAEAAPARHPGMHRTRSVDYAVVISGEIDMLLDDTEVHLKAGDVVVQRGTSHAWANRGTVPCRIAFVLVDAKPL